MKINSLLENQTPSSSTANTATTAPKFGRDDEHLEETTAGATGSGSVASDSSPIGKVRGRGSIFSGIKTSEKFPNSKVNEETDEKEELKTKYIQAAKDVLKGADFDHIIRIRDLKSDTLERFVKYAWDKVNQGEYKLNRPNLEEMASAFMPGIENTPEYKRGFSTGKLPVPYPEGSQQYVNYYKGVMDKAGPTPGKTQIEETNQSEKLFYAKLQNGQKVYARFSSDQELNDLKQRFSNAETKIMSFNRPDVQDWLSQRGVDLRKFMPGTIQTMGNDSELNEISLGDYPRKAQVSRALAQIDQKFYPDKPGSTQTIAKRTKGLERAERRIQQQRQEYERERKEKYEQELINKYSGVDIDSELNRLNSEYREAMNDYRYGASNTYLQAKERAGRLGNQIKELERAKQLLHKDISEASSASLRMAKALQKEKEKRERSERLTKSYLDKKEKEEKKDDGKKEEVKENSINENEISEEMLAHELYKDLQIFKKSKDKTISSKAKSKDLSNKPTDKEIINKVNKQKVSENTELNEFAPVGDDDGDGPDEEEILHKLASMWWLGNEQQMIKAQKTLEAMGWEIGEDEGYDNGGVFVVRSGDEHGRSYISWPHEDLQLNENLRKWFKEKWVRFGPDGKIRGACARGDDSEGKPKCLPQAKAHALGKKGRKYAASKKRREDPNPERRGPAKNVATKKKSNEGVAEGSLQEYGDTARGQKMLTKVQKRAVDRMIKADDKRDAKTAKKNQDTANRAWERMTDLDEQGVAEGVTPASISKVLRLIDRHHPEWFDNYGMGEVEDTVVDLADMGQFSGMSAADALELVRQELESLYGQQGVAEAGPFSYGKAPRKGSVADLAAKKRKEQERGKQPVDPRDQQVGVAKVTKGVAEGHADQQRKIFKKNGKPVGEVGIDRESSPGVGQWYMKCYAYDVDNSGYDSYEEAVAELKHCLKKGVAEGNNNLVDLGPALRDLTGEFNKFMKHDDRMKTDPAYAKKWNKRYAKYAGSSGYDINDEPDDDKKQGNVSEDSLNELSPGLLQRAAQVAKVKRDQALNPEVHNALGGGYMNPLAKHYDAAAEKFSDRATKIKQRDAVKKIASPAVLRKIGIGESNEDDIWGPQGNFAGDKKIEVGQDTAKKLQVGDTVTYFGEPARIVELNPSKNYARISSNGKTLNVKYSDVKRTGGQVNEISSKTLLSYLTKLDSDIRKHKSDPTKRSPEKRSKSVMGFSRAFNKLDARKDPLTNDEQLDELKCWPGYTRVQGVPAGAPGSCKKKTSEGKTERIGDRTVHTGTYGKSFNPSRGNTDAFGREIDTPKQTKPKSTGKIVPTDDVVQALSDMGVGKIKEEICPECGGPMFSELLINEKKDACYYKVKSRYKVWPSAYASGALVKCRKKGAKNWGNKSESLDEEKLDEKWSEKYKKSINCNNPKGFSQRAHCQGRKKK